VTTPPRLLTCTRCGEEVHVYEVPAPWIDPALYRCATCLSQRERAAQLTLLPRGRYQPRSEHVRYDPGQSAIPF
jgi:DNA-directed RNA polymerase subunit RPC12/RpoP